MGFLQKINATWEKIGVVQRALLIAIVIACVLVGGLLTKWATRPEMQLLYSDLSAEEAGIIVEKISKSNINYELRAGGTSIYVPSKQVYQLRLSMAKDGLPKGDQGGYKIFDNEKIGVSPLVQQINYNRAMQDELAKTIQMLDGVQFARVHLVRGEQSLFATEDAETSASVVLRVRPGWQISGASIAAITNLVAGAIDGLEAGKVTVVDSQGHLLTSKADSGGVVSSANTFMDYKDRVEQSIGKKVQDMLELVLGPSRSSVKVSAEIDMTSTETMTTKYEKGMPVEEIVNSTSTVKPGSKDSEGKETSGSSTDKTEKVENKYKVPETITKRLDVPGKVVSLAVSAVVDLSVPKPAVTEGEVVEGGEAGAAAASETESVMIMSVEEVKEIIRNAVGPSLLKDASSLIVVNTAFNRPMVAATGDSGGYEKLVRYIEIARQSSMGVLAICALLVLKIFSGARKKVSAAESGGVSGAGQLEPMGMGMLPAGVGDESSAAFRRHITGALKENPEQVKQLFASWLSGED